MGLYLRGIVGLAVGAGAFDWTNDKVTKCVQTRDSWPTNERLNTANTESYMCA